MGYIVQVVFIHIAYIHIESISYGILYNNTYSFLSSYYFIPED